MLVESPDYGKDNISKDKREWGPEPLLKARERLRLLKLKGHINVKLQPPQAPISNNPYLDYHELNKDKKKCLVPSYISYRVHPHMATRDIPNSGTKLYAAMGAFLSQVVFCRTPESRYIMI